jgi:hypothetical protein
VAKIKERESSTEQCIALHRQTLKRVLIPHGKDETITEEAHIAAHRFLVIGEDPGRIIFLVSIPPQDAGAIYPLCHTWAAWQEPDKSASDLVPQASDFAALIRSL